MIRERERFAKLIADVWNEHVTSRRRKNISKGNGAKIILFPWFEKWNDDGLFSWGNLEGSTCVEIFYGHINDCLLICVF